MTFFIPLLFALSTLQFDAPEGWRQEEPASSMRLAQWTLPGGPESGPAEVIVFYFGPGGGGGVEANLDRWMGQFVQPDGGSTRDRASVSELDAGALEVTLLDVRGTYVAAVRPGASERRNEPDHRMMAAVVEGESGPWFVRLLGPAATVGRHAADFEAFLKSFRLE